MILGKSFLLPDLSSLISLMGAPCLVCLGAGKLERCGEKLLIHSGSGVKIQPLIQETWAECLGTGPRVESGRTEELLFLQTVCLLFSSEPPGGFPRQDDEAPPQVKLHVVSQEAPITEMRKMLKL